MKTLFIGECGKGFAKALSDFGYKTVIMPPSQRLSKPVSSHADMLAIVLDKEMLMCDYYYRENKDIFGSYSVKTVLQSHFAEYPNDVLFNAFFTEKALYCKSNSVCPKILEYAEKRNIAVSDVKQGYAKCSVALTANGAVTSDPSIAKVMRQNGENVLVISPGGIELKGYDSGFIGGATFYDDGRLFVFGNLIHHADWKKIKDFCAETDTEVVNLSDDLPVDIGGAVLL
ncbi:MAG: hypothetical protein IKT65_05430 [Clostridia bacterium]|nr:hypothetical protein [Clostridia bacterium]